MNNASNTKLTATEEKRWCRRMAKEAQALRKVGMDEAANELVARCSEALQAAPVKRLLGKSVLEAARERIAWTFDACPRICLSGPSGKDSSVMMHLVCQEARRRGRRVGVLYLDLEAQYRLTIDHVREMLALYADVIDPFWVARPLHHRNAVSQLAPYWVCWDPAAEPLWPPADHPHPR
jgi:predicted phosphoadenosine phosphosulfate sulfurtransferase